MTFGEGMWRIQDKSVRAFLIEGKDRAMMVDTGFGTGNIRSVAESLTNKPLFLINTHSDGDHTRGNASFSETYMHPAEFSRYWDKCKIEFGIEGYVCPPRAIWEGDTIDLGTYCFEVIHIPGHTMGHIALLEREKRFLISGDTVQDGHIHLWGPGRNAYAFLASLEKLKKYCSSFDTIYPSHDTPALPPSIIPALADDARRMLAGEVEGVEPDPSCYPFKIEALLFEFPEAKLYFKPPQAR
jgi:glyoxylase-like metal-dependent hydrolase (beta-lactamase superfamily II)